MRVTVSPKRWSFTDSSRGGSDGARQHLDPTEHFYLRLVLVSLGAFLYVLQGCPIYSLAVIYKAKGQANRWTCNRHSRIGV